MMMLPFATLAISSAASPDVLMGIDQETLVLHQNQTQSTSPWNVLILDDPVNHMAYVTFVIRRIFGYSKDKAHALMMKVHTQGKAIVWNGEREKAEFYVEKLHQHQLLARLEKAGE